MGKWNFATCQHYISWYINPARENLTTRSNCGTNQGLKKNTLGWCRGVICNLHKITENRYPTSAPLPPPRKQVYPLNPLLEKCPWSAHENLWKATYINVILHHCGYVVTQSSKEDINPCIYGCTRNNMSWSFQERSSVRVIVENRDANWNWKHI